MKSAIAGLLAALSLCAFAQAPPSAPKPDVKIGDRWKFVQIDPLTKTSKDANQQVVLETGPDGFRIEESTPNGTLLMRRFDSEWNLFAEVKGKAEHQVRTRFPLEPGKSWQSKYEWTNGQNQHGEMDLSFTVGAWEKITVAAGTFDVLAVEAKGVWRNFTAGRSGIVMEKRWYSPAVKNMVRRAFTSRYAGGAPDQDFVIELQSYELKP